MADDAVGKINDLLKDYDVPPAGPKPRYAPVSTQPQQWASEDGTAMGVLPPTEVWGCNDCGVVVFDKAVHDRDHARKRQSRAGL